MTRAIVVVFFDTVAWMSAHPMQVLFYFALFVAVSYVIGSVVFAVWSIREERRQEAMAAHWQRIMEGQRARWPPDHRRDR